MLGRMFGWKKPTSMQFVKNQRYRFTHVRKLVFEGVFLGEEPTPEGDPEDDRFLTIAMDTREGSGSEWLRRAGNVDETITNIRPSLLKNVERVT